MIKYPRADLNRSRKKFWIMEVPVISTSHVKKNELDDLGTHSGVLYRDDYGILLHINEYMKWSGSVKRVVKFATSRGYCYLRLDDDGDVIEGLETYD